MKKLIIIKYGELWLKSDPVRRKFEKILKKNIKREIARQSNALKARSYSSADPHSEILLRNGRIFLYPARKTKLDFLKRTCEISSARTCSR